MSSDKMRKIRIKYYTKKIKNLRLELKLDRNSIDTWRRIVNKLLKLEKLKTFLNERLKSFNRCDIRDSILFK